MKNMLSVIWQRLRSILAPRRQESRSYQFDESLSKSLAELARHEQRPEGEMLNQLLSFAIAQHRNAQLYMECWHQLTIREQQIAALICLGYTNTEIARKLTISPETVKTHIRNVLNKFGLRRKVDLLKALTDWDFSPWDDPAE